MRTEPINTGNRIYPLNSHGHIDFKEFYKRLKEPYIRSMINLILPNKLNIYIEKKTYKEFMEHINDVIDELRRQIFPYGNYVTIGNLVDMYAK